MVSGFSEPFLKSPKLTKNSPGNSCNNYVANTPAAFSEAYWNIKSLKVWSQ